MQNTTEDFFTKIETIEAAELFSESDEVDSKSISLNEQYPLKDSTVGESYIYAISCPELALIKIGVSRSPDRRLAGLQSCFPCEIHLESVWIGSFEDEARIHRSLEQFSKRGEWFRMGAVEIIRTINAILDRVPVWQPDRTFKKGWADELLPEKPVHIDAFIDRWVVFEPKSRVIIGVLYKAYARWCKNRGGQCLGKSTFVKELLDRGVTKTPQKVGGQIWFLGVGLLAKPRTGTP